MAITQRDVAARAGVSSIVVSHVLHNRAPSVRVSEATAERVRQAAKELDYRVNVMARNFRSQQTNTIGVLHGLAYPSMRLDDRGGYFSSLMQGLIEGAFGHDYSITLCPQLTGSDPIGAMCDGRFDGLVWYSTTQTSTYYKVIETCSVPLVVIHASPEDVNHSRSTVKCDNAQGIELAVDHLYGLGHRKFAYAISDRHNPEAFDRLRAVSRHLTARGISFDPEADIIDVDARSGSTGAYFANGPRHTAVVCYIDHVAGTLIEEAQNAGYSVPKDLSVVGFDSTPYCNEFRPRITSVHQPIGRLGSIAIDLLVDQMKQSNAPVCHHIVPCSLDIRESTGPAPSR